MSIRARFRKIIVFLAVAASAASVRAADIAVVMSSDAEVYQEALEGFRAVIRHRISNVLNFKNNPAGWRDELKKLRTVVEPDLIFVIGTPALQAVAGENTNIPIVHTMVFNPGPSNFSAAKNVTGIAMLPAHPQVFALIKELNPNYRRIGVLFDPSKTAHLVAQARQAAQKEGLQLVAKEIQSPGEIPAALKSLRQEIELLWLLPDESIIADEILQRIFLFSFESKIPVVGFSERHTQTGALLSLSHGSVKDMGRQAAQLANALITEKKTLLSVQIPPNETKLTVNLKTARKLNLDIPDSIVSRAVDAVKAPVYREGDWWVYRIKIIDYRGVTTTEVQRVMFKNGKFESDDPSFLTGGDLVGGPYFLPFASVYVTDPAKRWLHFPLAPGKTWSFSYIRRYYHQRDRGTQLTATAHVEVIGRTPQLIETPAGQFEAIEISRTDRVGTPPPNLTYFYSPKTQSVIKLRAQISSIYQGHFDLELIAYGNSASGK